MAYPQYGSVQGSNPDRSAWRLELVRRRLPRAWPNPSPLSKRCPCEHQVQGDLVYTADTYDLTG